MRPGGLRQRVTIQNFTTSRTPSGGVIQEWYDVATVWAEVKGISGRELIAAGAEMSEVTFRMWVRYRSDVKAFDIQSAIPDEKATRLELLCKGGLKP